MVKELSNVETDNVNTDSHRNLPDRRIQHTKSFFYSFFKRRRKAVRRTSETQTNVYVDVHDPLTVGLFIAIILFCVFDAIMTLIIIQAGGKEVNPVMKYIMDKDVMMFFWVKFSMTSLGMLILVSHKTFVICRGVTGSSAIKSIFVLYFLLMIYELVLVSHLLDSTI